MSPATPSRWLLACCLLLLCAPSLAWGSGCPACRGCDNVVLVGQSAGSSQLERGAAEGLAAALAEASLLTTLRLNVSLLHHDRESELKRNVKVLVEEKCVFMVAATVGTSASEPDVLRTLREHRVPLVGALSASRYIRNRSFIMASYRAADAGVPGARGLPEELPFVVNVRASGVDELNAVLSLLTHNWTALQQVAMATHDMPYDTWAIAYVNASLRALTGTRGLVSYAALNRSLHVDDEVDEVVERLLGRGNVSVLIVTTTPNTTAALVEGLGRSGRSLGLKVFFVSWVSPEDLAARLGNATAARLEAGNVSLLFTQSMPSYDPRRLWRAPSLLRRFGSSAVRDKTSHTALEGYLAGWFIYEAAQQAVARYGLPLTQQKFLAAVFDDVRTFNVLGVALGPYGDGTGVPGALSQSAGDRCNQGVHEVFVTRYHAANRTQSELQGATLKFKGCTAPEWNREGALTVVGYVDDPADGVDLPVTAGLIGALNDHNADGAGSLLLRSVLASQSTAARDELRLSKAVAVLAPRLERPEDVGTFEGFATIAPMPVLEELLLDVRAHRLVLAGRYVINLFANANDEMMAASMFFMTKGVKSVGVIKNDDTRHTEQCLNRVKKLNGMKGYEVTYSKEFVGDAEELVRKHEGKYDAFLILGGSFSGHRVPRAKTMRLLNSRVVMRYDGFNRSSSVADVTYSLSVVPPMSNFASTSPLRTEYAAWVSDSTNDSARSFAGFLVGRFLAQVVNIARSSKKSSGGGGNSSSLESDDLVKAVYERSIFVVGGMQFGPFKDKCSDPRDCCNQGSSTVYVQKGDLVKTLAGTYSAGNCSWWKPLTPPGRRAQTNDLSLILGLSIGLGGAAILCLAVLIVVTWRARRTVEFLNIRRGEIELGQCLGHGRFGAMYMADWHGTTVAVRVIDKKATPKEDQRLIKEEVLLLHKHHHPNLLMLMGYCENGTDILVVTEYMEGGTLADYLAKEKRYVSVFSLVSLAFDVLKGIAYLHSCKPPIVHGSICTHNLLMDGKGTVKVSDFWFSNKRGAFSSGSCVSLKRAAWQPPEVIAGSVLTPATDVYAFGIVLWELIAPPDAITRSSSASGTASEGQQSAAPPGSSMEIGCATNVQHTLLGPPEMPQGMSPMVSHLLERCWETQPERRPSIFQILRNWSTTFASLGAFDIPQELIRTAVCSNSGGLFSRHTSSGSCNNNGAKAASDSGDEMAVSMMSIMPVRVDSVALQLPQAADLEHSVADQLAVSMKLGIK
eukprot:m51a1_g8869 putative serine threonine-protein kinase ctr1-like (1250) ;mRNA; r:590014-594475